MPEGIPAQIGRYKILDELGHGGFGCVYRAFDASVGRQVAIKILTERGKDVLTRFRNEALVAGNLRHENIVTVYEYGDFEGQPFLAMEYLEGEDLQHIMAARKPLSLLDKCTIMSQVAEGLYCAHRNGVVHRDVKPANIMVRPDGVVKIMDFGIARLTRDSDATRLTQEGCLIGTLLYMAPEQFSGSEIDALCDIFAYGVIYYELLTGRHPFEAPDSRALMYKISFEDPPPISSIVPECPAALERVILRILSKDRELRYQSLREVQFDTGIVRIELQRQRAAELLAQAQTEFEQNRLDAAQALLVEVLSLDPANRVARTLREGLENRLRQRALKPRIDALLSGGDEHLEHRRFADALQSFEAALRLDRENTSIQNRIEQVRSLIEHSRAAAALLVEARKEYENQNLTAAFRAVSEALHHDRQNPGAAELMATIQAAIERRRREQRIDEALHKAEGLLLLHSYDEAIELLTALGPDAASPKVERLLEWLRREKAEQERRRRLQSEISAATGLLRARRLSEAVERLRALTADYPDDKDATQLLAYAQGELEAEARVKAIQEVAEKAGALADSSQFDSALALLEDTLKRYPGESALIRILGATMAAKADWERREAIANTHRECARLRAAHRFPEAIETVEATLRDYSAEPALVELLDQLEREWLQKQRADAVREAAVHAANLLEKAQPADAAEYLKEALLQYPGEHALLELSERAREAVRAIERARTIEAIRGEVSALVGAHEYDRALASINRGLESWPEDAALLLEREKLNAAKADWERREEIRRASESAGQLAARRSFGDALHVLAAALQKYPGDADLMALQARIGHEWEQQKRRDAISATVAEIRRLMSGGRLDQALAAVEAAEREYPGDGDLEAVAAQVHEAIRARERALAIEKIVQSAQELAAAQDFGAAAEVLRRGLGEFPGETALLRQSESVETARTEWEREQALKKVIADSTQLARDLRFDEAIERLSRSPVYSPALLETRRRIENERDLHLRREAIVKGAADAAALLDRGRLDEAMKLLEELNARYTGEPDWEPLLARAREEHRARALAEERRRAVEETSRDCEHLARQARFEEALKRVADALERWPDQPALLDLDGRLKRDWEAQERAEAVARAAREAQEAIDAGRLEDAIGSLCEACARYSGEPTLTALLARAECELEAREAHRAAVREICELLENQQLEEAIESLGQALTRFPRDPELSGLLTRARERLELRRREEAIRKLVDDAQALSNQRGFARALMLLERGLATWPEERRILEARESVRSAEAAWRREQARREILDALAQLARRELFAEGLGRAEAALKEYPEDAEFVSFEREFRMRKGVADAAALLAAGRPDDALRILDDPAEGASAAPEWSALRERARSDMAARERAAAIERRKNEAEGSAQAGNFERALAVLASALREWPDAAVLVEARNAVLAAKALRERQQAIRDAAAACERLESEDRLAAAIELAEKSLRDFPEQPALLQVRDRLQRKFDEAERRRRRDNDLGELRGMEAAAAQAREPSQLADLRDRARRIAAQYPGDEEMRSAAAPAIRHLSDIETAERETANRNFGAVLEICQPYLARFPEHAVFKTLEVEALRGVKAAYLEDARRRAGAAQALDARARILEEALGRYPGESWVESELDFTRTRLALIDSIAAQARAHEAAGEWELALDQWKRLADIYDRFPGLENEIARVKAARERANAEAVARWVREIEEQIGCGELGQAGELLRRALAELPGAVPLHECGRRLDELRKKQKRVRDLLSLAQAARENGDWQELASHLDEALGLSAGQPVLRRRVVEAWLDHARPIAGTDWRLAEDIVTRVRAAEPASPIDERLLRTISDGKRSAAVDALLERARQLQSSGDVRGALAYLAQALRDYPGEERLESLRQDLARQLGERRARIAGELRAIAEFAAQAPRAIELHPLETRVAAIAAEVRADPELVTLAGETSRSIATRRRHLVRERFFAALAARRGRIAVAAGAAAVLTAAILALPPLLKSMRTTAVIVTSETAGAAVTVAGQSCVTPQCTLKLRPGSYSLAASRDGFKPISRPLTISPGLRQIAVPLLFEPLPEQLQVNTNFESGSVYVDGRLAGPLRDSQFSLSGLAPGLHSIRISGGGAEFRADWRSAPGAVPQLTALAAKDVEATVLSDAGATGAIACNCGAESITLDGTPAGRTVPGSALFLSNLREGSRRIAVGGRSLVVDIRPNPSLNIFLALDRNAGTLVVETGEDGARVYLNGRPYPRHTEHGALRIPVEAGEYSVRVEKDGFRNSAPVPATVAKGEEKQVAFRLEPMPPVLELAGALPGAEVNVDDRRIGETSAAGTFRAEVTAGRHSVRISKEGYAPLSFDEQFTPGKTVRPDQARLAMAKLVPPPPPERKPADTEPQDWDRVANSSRPEEFDDFLRKHPNGAHADEARSRAARLRQLQQQQVAAEAARKAEQSAWDGLDKNNKAAIQDFLGRYGGGPHALEARSLIDNITKREADEAAARQHAKELNDRATRDEAAVLQTLRDLEAAYGRKEFDAVQRIWTMSDRDAKTVKNALRDAKSITLSLKPVGRPVISGDSANVDCTRTTTFTANYDGHRYTPPSDRVHVTLSRTASGWVVRQIESF